MFIIEKIATFIKDKILYKRYLNNKIFALKKNIFEYDFLMSLDPKFYKKYLKIAYKLQSGKRLNLHNPQTYTEKIQWLKLYDNIPIKTTLTDKLLVRDWIKNEIGEQYLKPLLQVCNSFDEINFDNLPDSFVIKCNHGCKWQFIIKDKKSYLENKSLFPYTRKIIDRWLSKNYFGVSMFETQYKNITPKILVEKFMEDNSVHNYTFNEIEVLCFNGNPKIIDYHTGIDNPETSIYDENYNSIDLKYTDGTKLVETPINNHMKKAVELSKLLSKQFKLVRVDWMIYENNLYFNEMTFTPRSGFIIWPNGYEYWDKKLGEMLNLKGN